MTAERFHPFGALDGIARPGARLSNIDGRHQAGNLTFLVGQYTLFIGVHWVLAPGAQCIEGGSVSCRPRGTAASAQYATPHTCGVDGSAAGRIQDRASADVREPWPCSSDAWPATRKADEASGRVEAAGVAVPAVAEVDAAPTRWCRSNGLVP